MQPNLILISHAKRTLDPDSRERARMRTYAAAVEHLHIIVFTHQADGFPGVQYDDNLTLYATNNRSRLAMLVRAYRIGTSILNRQPSTQFVVSSQDPFETSLIGRLLTNRTQHTHHVQIHGDVFNPLSYRSSLLQRLRTVYGRRVVTSTIAIRVVSKRIKDSLVALGVSPQAITVLPIQSDMTKFLAVGESRQKDQSERLQLLFVGRLAPEKNLGLLLSACAQLKQSGVAFDLRIVGDGPEQATLQARVDWLNLTDVVTFVGWHEAIAQEMSQATVLCLSSDHEGWAMVLQEAAAAGLAIITTDVGCAGEFIIDGEQGVVVPVGDVAAYAAGLDRLRDPHLRARLGQAAHAKAAAATTDYADYVSQVVAAHLPN